jgi:hypothetical protein
VATVDAARGTLRSLFLAIALFGCGGDLRNQDADQSGPLAVPSRTNFEPVADAMQLHCGTLDCHGQIGRNMRLYGQFGLRLDPKNNPLDQATTPAEYDACYGTMVGLEPEALSNVVKHRADPESLSMIRKPRGREKHKGGQLVLEDDPLDRCMVGWVLGAIDIGACNTVVQTPRPKP